MKIKERIIRAFKSFSASPRTLFFSIAGMGARLRARSVEVDPAGNYAGWVYAAISKRAKRVGAIDLELYEMNARGELNELEDHELLSILDRANPIQSRYQFFYTLEMYLGIWGSAPVYKDRAGGKRIQYLWPLRPDCLTAKTDNAGNIVEYVYSIGGGIQKLNPSDVVLINEPSPRDLRSGNSPMAASALEIDADVAAAVFNRHLIENWGEPGGVLSTEQKLSDVEFARLKQTWDERNMGPQNAGRVSLLEKGLKYEAVGRSPKDLDLVDSRKFHRNAIVSIPGVPMGLMTSEDVNLANAEVAERVFSKDTIDPEMKLITSCLNEFLVPEFGPRLWLDYESPVREDVDQIINVSNAIATIATTNERRDMFKLPPIEGGDSIFLPIGVMPQIGDGVDPNPFSSSEDGAPKGWAIRKVKVQERESPKEKRIRKSINARTWMRRKLTEGIAEKVFLKISEKIAEHGNSKKSVIKVSIKGARLVDDSKKKDTNETELSPRLKADRMEYLAQLPKQQKKFITQLRGFFKTQLREVLDNLESEGLPKSQRYAKKSIDKWINKIIFDQAAQNKVLLKVAGDMYKDNIMIGAAAIAKLLGVDPIDVLLSPYTATFIDKRSFIMLSVNETTRDSLRVNLSEAIANGESIGDIRNRITNIYSEAQGFRAETIARTEVGSAQNYGRTQEMEVNKAEKKVWIATFSNTREAHAAADGQVVGIHDHFNVGGESLEYPGDPSGSPENIINCQCSVSPTL